MKSFIIAFIMVIIFGIPAFALDDWTDRDTNLQIGTTLLILFDVYQTDIAIQNGGFESGPAQKFVGKNPNSDQLYIYFFETALLNYGLSRLLPKKIRTLFQYSSISYECYWISASWGTKIVFNLDY